MGAGFRGDFSHTGASTAAGRTAEAKKGAPLFPEHHRRHRHLRLLLLVISCRSRKLWVGLQKVFDTFRRRWCPLRYAAAAQKPPSATALPPDPLRGGLATTTAGGTSQKAPPEKGAKRDHHRRRRRSDRPSALRCKVVPLPDCPEPEPNPEPSPRRENSHSVADTAPKRPAAFRRVNREARVRQLERHIGEFCALDFEAVDPAQQMGLTHRMLVILRTLTGSVSYWDDDVQQQMGALRLLDLDEASAIAIEEVIRRAAFLIEQQAYRNAYLELCEARRWLLARGAEDEHEPLRGNQLQNAREGAAVTKPKRREATEENKAGRDGRKRMEAASSAFLQPNDVVVKAQPNGLRGSSCLPILLGAQGAASKVVEETQPSSQIGRRQADTAAAPRSKCREGEGKFLCRFRVGIKEEPAFQVCRRLIGPGGRHMKQIIAEAHGAKLRLRGQGSKYLEGLEKVESSEPLMVCVSATSRSSFERSAALVERLLQSTHDDYREFCAARGWPKPDLLVRRESQRAR